MTLMIINNFATHEYKYRFKWKTQQKIYHNETSIVHEQVITTEDLLYIIDLYIYLFYSNILWNF